MPLQVWLLNPYKIVYPWTELRQHVQDLMTPVVTKRDATKKPKYGSVVVSSRYTKPPVGVNDLAVYVVPVRNFGFVGVGFGSGGREHGDGLTTYSGGEVCSEVYLGEQVSTNGNGELITVERMTNEDQGVWVKSRFAPRLVANLIFHELMHNVTPSWDEHKMHKISGVSLGKESINENTQQSVKDVEILADNMDKTKQTQWTGAWQYLINEGWAPQ